MTGFRVRSAGGFCFVLKGRGRPWPRRKQDDGGRGASGAVSPHRAVRGSGQAAGRTESVRPQPLRPVLPSPVGPFLDPSAGLAGTQGRLVPGGRPGSGVRRPALEGAGGGRLLGWGAEDGVAWLDDALGEGRAPRPPADAPVPSPLRPWASPCSGTCQRRPPLTLTASQPSLESRRGLCWRPRREAHAWRVALISSSPAVGRAIFCWPRRGPGIEDPQSRANRAVF